MIPRPSRSHWTAAPVTKTAPSSAYVQESPTSQATVVSSPSRELGARSPVFSSRNEPVPYVFFDIPGVKQACPNSAACWSPATPAIGTAAPSNASSASPAISPSTPLDGRTSGSSAAGTPIASSRMSSHFRSWML